MKNVLRSNAVGALLVAGLFWFLPPESPIADAAMRGDVETVRSLVKEGGDVNASQGDGMTALHWAALTGKERLVELLIYAGANIGALTRLGDYTPLHLASKEGDAVVVEALLAAGADPNAPTSTGEVTPLHFAAGSGNVGAISALPRPRGCERERGGDAMGTHAPHVRGRAQSAGCHEGPPARRS